MATAPKLEFGEFTRGKRVLHASQRQHQRAARSLPLGVSDTYRYWGDDATIYMKRGKGALLWDLDGNRYVDFRLGWGPIILGYGDERVDRAARRGIEVGGIAALATELEASVAELMIEMVPSVEKVRFANSGSEAVATALRVARGHSGRDGFVMVGGPFHCMVRATACSIPCCGARRWRAGIRHRAKRPRSCRSARASPRRIATWWAWCR